MFLSFQKALYLFIYTTNQLDNKCISVLETIYNQEHTNVILSLVENILEAREILEYVSINLIDLRNILITDHFNNENLNIEGIAVHHLVQENNLASEMLKTFSMFYNFTPVFGQKWEDSILRPHEKLLEQCARNIQMIFLLRDIFNNPCNTGVCNIIPVPITSGIYKNNESVTCMSEHLPTDSSKIEQITEIDKKHEAQKIPRYISDTTKISDINLKCLFPGCTVQHPQGRPWHKKWVKTVERRYELLWAMCRSHYIQSTPAISKTRVVYNSNTDIYSVEILDPLQREKRKAERSKKRLKVHV